MPPRYACAQIRKTLRQAGIVLPYGLCAFYLTCVATPSYAEDNLAQKLHSLAQQMVERVGPQLDTADNALNGKNPQQQAIQRQLESIPDGEILILQPVLTTERVRRREKFTSPDAILAYKQGSELYIDLYEFSRLAGFNIAVDPENGTATGTIYNADQPFSLDTATQSVSVNNSIDSFASDDVVNDGAAIFVRTSLIEKWFDLRIEHSPQSLSSMIYTRTPVPTQERIARMNLREKGNKRPPPELPRMESPDKIFTLPRADVSLAQEVVRRKAADGERLDRNRSSYNILTTNEVAGHETTSFFSGSNAQPLDQVRLNFRKESENNDLLGPLEAKLYEFGDLRTVQVPNTGAGSLERGVRVSSQGERFTVDSETTIDGNAQPGWDVELYRNDVFVAGQVVGIDGYYAFEQVTLFAGDNNIKVILYGPQGQVQEETRLITVAPQLLGNLKGYYDVSVSQKNEITYRADQNENDDTGTIRLAATYDRKITDTITGRGGIHSRQTLGQRDNYFYTGLATNWRDVVYNADLVTTSDGPFSTNFLARKRLGEHNIRAGAAYRAANFSPSYIDEKRLQSEALYGVNAGATGPWFRNIFSRVNYEANLSFNQSESGFTQANSSLGLSSYFAGIRFNNRLASSQQRGGNSNSENTLLYTGSAFGRFKGLQWQTGLGYEIQPESEPVDYSLRLTKTLTPNLSTSFDARHTFNDQLSTATASLNYSTEKAVFSPSITYDSDSNMRAYLGVNFSLAKDPYSDDVIMTNRRVGSQGGFSTFAYLDKNGNGIFESEDEPLQDVVINLKHLNRSLITDKEGKAFAHDLGVTRITDVAMETNTSFEPTWLAGVEGFSYRPRPGDVTYYEFPIIRGAEIDGTATLASTTDTALPARSMTIKLITPDGETVKSTTTPFDGFYIIERIRPGVYYMTTDSSQSPTTAYRLPEKIVITPEGAQIYGKNIELTRGYDIPFTFSAANTNPALARRTKILKPEDIAREDVYIRLGNYRSGVALALDWYKFKLRSRGWQNRLTPVATDFDSIVRDANTGLLPLRLQPTQPLRLADAALLCERLVDAGFKDCSVDVVTTYHGDEPQAVSASATPSKG